MDSVKYLKWIFFVKLQSWTKYCTANEKDVVKVAEIKYHENSKSKMSSESKAVN